MYESNQRSAVAVSGQLFIELAAIRDKVTLPVTRPAPLPAPMRSRQAAGDSIRRLSAPIRLAFRLAQGRLKPKPCPDSLLRGLHETDDFSFSELKRNGNSRSGSTRSRLRSASSVATRALSRSGRATRPTTRGMP